MSVCGWSLIVLFSLFSVLCSLFSSFDLYPQLGVCLPPPFLPPFSSPFPPFLLSSFPPPPVLANPKAMHEKTGPQESKLYVPLYHASAYPSSDVEAMGVVRVSIVPSLLHTVDRAGLALLLSYVTQAVAGLTPPGTTTTEATEATASTALNYQTMALMEKELESVLTEREGYRNRVRALEIALTETTMICDRMTWERHALNDDGDTAAGGGGGKKKGGQPALSKMGSSSKLIHATASSPKRRVVAPVAKYSVKEDSVRRTSLGGGASKQHMNPSVPSSSSQGPIPSSSSSSSSLQVETKVGKGSSKGSNVVQNRAPLSSEAVVERALAVQDMARAFRQERE